ncbi:MAG: YtxH domain-containing protein [Dehalococcoidia bacterium]|nr:MAG: YtxH domain-containing protein [Dehalococcoidia bacterium]
MRFLFGFVLGAIVGAAWATLMAPAPGHETRQRLEEAWRERTSEETRARAQEAIGKAREGVAAARHRLEEALRAGREAQEEAEEEMRAQREEAIKSSGE